MRHTGIVFILLFLGLSVQAQQSRSELEKRRQAIVESLKETQAQLEATKKDHKATMSQLNALQAKLNARERLIRNINQEMGNLDNDIKNSSSEVQTLRGNLKVQQERYAQSVRYAYANRSSYNTLSFIFSAKDFNDAMRRMKYMKRYREYRKNQVDEIRSTQTKIEQKINVLSTVKNQKGQLLSAEEQQKLALQEEKNETNKVVEELKGREKELVADVENKRKVTKRIDNAISEAIRKEIEIARKKAEEEERKRRVEEEQKAAALAAAKAAANNPNTYGSGPNKVILAGGNKTEPATTAPATTTTRPNTTAGKPAANNTGGAPATYNPVAATVKPSEAPTRTKTTYTPSTTPEVAELSKGFETNRGKLPWPVASGVVIDAFGKHKHAIATKVEVDNSGIDIQTSPGAKARAVFDGTVSSVMNIAGAGQTVIINHGKYFTVYCGLNGANVKKGDQVTTKQIIGTVGNNEDGVAVMNFQVWKGGDKMNPSGWIAPM
ncbi:MAG TPA: peptidoglycan DD-metalloendopeptidase family protein [Chitinophagaceae bacterium]|nr:peptidoglycan DD-metalloendopeptidase family protein [Chitinophagaceae bacterium]